MLPANAVSIHHGFPVGGTFNVPEGALSPARLPDV